MEELNKQKKKQKLEQQAEKQKDSTLRGRTRLTRPGTWLEKQAKLQLR